MKKFRIYRQYQKEPQTIEGTNIIDALGRNGYCNYDDMNDVAHYVYHYEEVA
ncbi:MAG TPA: hypothetical protein VJH33_03395 [Candidatus Paceibacterota bacterium]